VGVGESRKKRSAIEDALKYFEANVESFKHPGRESIEILLGRFLIPARFLDYLCKNFRSVLACYGRYIAGDEKLFHFTGDSAFIRSVPSKPDAIGLWYFELACKIADKDPYMLHIWLISESSTAMGLHIPVSSVTEKWAEIAKEQNPPPLATFDSYYTDLTGTRMISNMGVPYIGALHPSRFPALVAMMDAHFKTLAAGSTGALWNQDSQELFIKHNDNTLGMKYVLSNAYSPSASTRSGQRVVPIYDDFSSTFSVCDKYNKSLSNRLYPFRFGGRSTKGEHGNVHKLAMGVVLSNLDTACGYILKIEDVPVDFSSMCDELSISLISMASAM